MQIRSKRKFFFKKKEEEGFDYVGLAPRLTPGAQIITFLGGGEMGERDSGTDWRDGEIE